LTLDGEIVSGSTSSVPDDDLEGMTADSSGEFLLAVKENRSVVGDNTMELTRIERKTLQSYRGLRADKGSVTGQIRRNVYIFIYWFVLAILLVPIAYLISDSLGMLLLGAITASALRDIRYFMRTKQIWPMVEEIMNWPRIEELLDN